MPPTSIFPIRRRIQWSNVDNYKNYMGPPADIKKLHVKALQQITALTTPEEYEELVLPYRGLLHTKLVMNHWTTLGYAAFVGNISLVKHILSNSTEKKVINLCSSFGFSPLICAVLGENLIAGYHIAKMLIKHGADVNYGTCSPWCLREAESIHIFSTALHIVVEHKQNLPLMRLLILNQAIIYRIDDNRGKEIYPLSETSLKVINKAMEPLYGRLKPLVMSERSDFQLLPHEIIKEIFQLFLMAVIDDDIF